LVDSLFNRRFRHERPSGSADIGFSVALVVGEVIAVDKGPTFIHVGDDRLQEVDFDDPTGVERTIDVRVRVDQFFEAEGQTTPPPAGEITFRWGGLGKLDRTARDDYIASAQSLGRVVAVLDARKDRDRLVYIPILMGALLGQVRNDGTLRFPGLGDRERSFLGDITTLAALTHAARAVLTIPPGKGRSSTRWVPSTQSGDRVPQNSSRPVGESFRREVSAPVRRSQRYRLNPFIRCHIGLSRPHSRRFHEDRYHVQFRVRPTPTRCRPRHRTRGRHARALYVRSRDQVLGLPIKGCGEVRVGW